MNKRYKVLKVYKLSLIDLTEVVEGYERVSFDIACEAKDYFNSLEEVYREYIVEEVGDES